MTNFAALIPAAKAPLEVQEVDTYTPGPNELLIRNEVIAFNPREWKSAKLAIFPLQYPAILGSTLGGIVEAVGSNITKFKAGDRVAALRNFESEGNQYGIYQRYVVVQEIMTSKVPAKIDLAIPASVVLNLTAVAGMFTGRLGLEKPVFDASAAAKDVKVLVYGGSSSFGALSVQYLAQAGYQVYTTSSPKHHDFVSTLGAAKVIDHTLKSNTLVDELVASGPFDFVVDSIAFANTIAAMAKVVKAQGGGELYTLQPPFGPEDIPTGVTRVFEPWSASLFEEKNDGLLEWTIGTYLPQGLSGGSIKPLPIEKIQGGLKGVNEALDRMQKGVSGVRLVVDPWE